MATVRFEENVLFDAEIRLKRTAAPLKKCRAPYPDSQLIYKRGGKLLLGLLRMRSIIRDMAAWRFLNRNRGPWPCAS